MSSEDPKTIAAETESLRKLAFFGIAISTVATLTAIVAVPMLYNYMQHVQSSLQTEVDFCHHRTDGLWDEYKRVRLFSVHTTYNYIAVRECCRSWRTSEA